MLLFSDGQQGLDGAALVHRAIALRHLIQRQSQIENLAGVDLSVQYKLDQFRQVASHRSRPTVQVDVSEEQLFAIERDTVRRGSTSLLDTVIPVGLVFAYR